MNYQEAREFGQTYLNSIDPKGDKTPALHQFICMAMRAFELQEELERIVNSPQDSLFLADDFASKYSRVVGTVIRYGREVDEERV